MKIQFYSLTTVENAVATVDAGADLIGLVVEGGIQVPEEISVEHAREIFNAIDGRALGIALSLSTDPDIICCMANAVQPHAVHLAARNLTTDALAQVRADLDKNIRIMAAIPVTGPEAVDVARERSDYSDYFLLDSVADSQADITGVTGKTHDWNISRQIVEAVSIPVVLAGGLSPDNVAKAIEVVRPWGVDSYTHTNLPGDRMLKDLDQVHAFVRNTRDTAARLGL
ncbi:MAG: phosphoribosylanthranilate isomerase [Gammaproteobacteria bacterium]|jgi:phosphoribosylanthranilate isomerase|nr:phosphoribosylanthranilate isomerase [Gammaproteobacteria bacterium]